MIFSQMLQLSMCDFWHKHGEVRLWDKLGTSKFPIQVAFSFTKFEFVSEQVPQLLLPLLKRLGRENWYCNKMWWWYFSLSLWVLVACKEDFRKRWILEIEFVSLGELGKEFMKRWILEQQDKSDVISCLSLWVWSSRWRRGILEEMEQLYLRSVLNWKFCALWQGGILLLLSIGAVLFYVTFLCTGSPWFIYGTLSILVLMAMYAGHYRARIRKRFNIIVSFYYPTVTSAPLPATFHHFSFWMFWCQKVFVLKAFRADPPTPSM